MFLAWPDQESGLFSYNGPFLLLFLGKRSSCSSEVVSRRLRSMESSIRKQSVGPNCPLDFSIVFLRKQATTIEA